MSVRRVHSQVGESIPLDDIEPVYTRIFSHHEVYDTYLLKLWIAGDGGDEILRGGCGRGRVERGGEVK